MRMSDIDSSEILENETIPADLVANIMRSKYLDDLKDDAPSFEEIRDMFSEGQLASKIWLAKVLHHTLRTQPYLGPIKKVLIVGAWYGTLKWILHQHTFGFDVDIDMIDIDERCANTYDQLYPYARGMFLTSDMYDAEEIDYSRYDLVINTSCEHIPSLRKWLDLLPDGTKVVLQSNDMFSHPQHVACVANTLLFRDQAQLSSYAFEGRLRCQAYTRFMMIGTK